MKPLLDHQQKLLDRLKDPASPSLAVIASVIGAGVRRVIEAYLRDLSSAGSLVLVLSPTRVLVDQWADRLRAREDVPVTVLDSANTALQLLEESSERRGRVLLATYTRATHGPSSLVLSKLDFGLIVHDEPLATIPEQVERLHSRARRVITLVARRSPGFWSRWPLLADITFNDIGGVGDRAIAIDVPFELSNEERALRKDATGLLSEHAARHNIPFALPSDSLPALHARLLSLVSASPSETNGGAADNPEDLAERAWMLLDRIEESREGDPRLDTLDTILEQRLAAGARCFIVAPMVVDIRYVADHLAGTGRAPRAILTGADPATERRSTLQSLGPGESIVATHAAFAFVDTWPADSAVILWPSPRQRVLREIFAMLEEAPGVQVFQLKERNSIRGSVS